MSGALAGVGLPAAAAAGGALIGLFTSPTRMIGPIIPGIVLEEDHNDTITITDHPVERGANITDHAFKQPSTLNIQCQWSNTQAALYDFSESYINTIYNKLLALQLARTVISVVTGKRPYNNMLIESIATSTDQRTAFCLPVQISLREVILVSTSITSVPPADVQATPQQTAPVISSGQNLLQGNGAGAPLTLMYGLQSAQSDAVAAIKAALAGQLP